jgi:hypothetical protein
MVPELMEIMPLPAGLWRQIQVIQLDILMDYTLFKFVMALSDNLPFS